MLNVKQKDKSNNVSNNTKFNKESKSKSINYNNLLTNISGHKQQTTLKKGKITKSSVTSPKNEEYRNFSSEKKNFEVLLNNISPKTNILSKEKLTEKPSESEFFKNHLLNRKSQTKVNSLNNSSQKYFNQSNKFQPQNQKPSKTPDVKPEEISQKNKIDHKRSLSILLDKDKKPQSKENFNSPKIEFLLQKFEKYGNKVTETSNKATELFCNHNNAINSPQLSAKNTFKETFKSKKDSSLGKISCQGSKSQNFFFEMEKQVAENKKQGNFSVLSNKNKEKLIGNYININLNEESNIETEFSKKSKPNIVKDLQNKNQINTSSSKSPAYSNLQYKLKENSSRLKSAKEPLLLKDKAVIFKRENTKSNSNLQVPLKIMQKPVDKISELEKNYKLKEKPDSKQASTRKMNEVIITNIFQEQKKKVKTTNSSPQHNSLKSELLNGFLKKKNEIEPEKLIENMKKNEDHNKKQNNQDLKLKLDSIRINVNSDDIDNILNESNISSKSTVRESHYFRNICEKLTSFIKKYYEANNEYPVTTMKFYKFGRVLGKGAFGKVNLCLHILSGRIVAVKSFNKSKLKNENSKKKIFYECSLMKNLRHNFIVNIFEKVETDKYIFVIMEYISGGDLLTFVRKRTKLNETTAKFIFRQIIEALQFIHSQNVVHRDIKLDNILIDVNNSIKICDFGVSKIVKKGEVMYDQCGTPAYIAPEILKNNGYEGFSVDIWSAGVVLYAILSGTVPFKASNMNDLHKMIMKGSFNPIKDISDEAHSLLAGILEIDPKKRMTIVQILSHPWMIFNENNGKFKSKLNLFTIAEKQALTKSNVNYKTAGKDEIIENFTLRNIDTQKDLENQNILTKSGILAPFNSSRNPESYFLSKELKMENEILRFCRNAREANRNYELNNNGEIDNGILISPLDSKKNSLSMSNKKDDYSKPCSPPVELESKKISNLNSPVSGDSQRNHLKYFTTNSTSGNTFILDENIVKQIEEFGYKREHLMKSLLSNELNYVTTTYFLLLNFKLETN